MKAYIEADKNACIKHNIPRQPHVMIMGDTLIAASHYYVVFDDHMYQMDSLIKAVDICFKVFFIFNLEYPTACADMWVIFQKSFFGINTPYDGSSPRVKDLCGFFQTVLKDNP